MVRRHLRSLKRLAKRLFPRTYLYLRYGTTNPNTRRFWDRRYAAEGQSIARAYTQLHERVVTHISPGAVVLDVGCGAGHLLLRMRAVPGVTAIGTDFSRAAIKLLHEQGIPGVVADAARLPFADGRFDVVTCCEMLEHVDDPEAAVKEIMRILRDNGLGVFSVPDVPVGKIEDTDEHVRQFTADSFESYLSVFGDVLDLARVRDEVVHPSGERWSSKHVLVVLRKR